MAANRRLLLKYKQDKCLLCPRKVQETIDQYGPNAFHRAFQFHHVDPATKAPDYDNLMRRSFSTEQLNELDKCVLVCNWCHVQLENQNNKAKVTIRVTVDGRTAEQTLHGQVLVDQVSKIASFVTNERMMAIPYRVFLGDAEPRLDFGTELEAGKLLIDYLARLPQLRKFAIRTWRENALMLEAEFIEPDSMRVKYDVEFPVIQAELTGDTSVWTRNGIGLTDGGEILEDWVVEFEAKIPSEMTPSKPESLPGGSAGDPAV